MTTNIKQQIKTEVATTFAAGGIEAVGALWSAAHTARDFRRATIIGREGRRLRNIALAEAKAKADAAAVRALRRQCRRALAGL